AIRTRKVLRFLTVYPDLVLLVVRDEGGLAPLKNASDATHMFESGERLRMECVNESQIRILENRFHLVRGLGIVVQIKAPSGSGHTLWSIQIKRPESNIGDVTPEIDEGTSRVIPEVPVSSMAPIRIIGPFGSGT